MTDRILCVDDEPNILQAYQRALRKQFNIETAQGGEPALKAISEQEPFSVIVADMRMPGMDGVQLLKEVKKRSPNTVRIMLTGNADQQTAIDAVNEGNIFRFLNKPCPPENMAKALNAAIEQHKLIIAEKELLEMTLRGSIKVLTDVLSLTNPTAFGHASRIRRLVRKLCDELGITRTWQFEVAAMLSQIGCVTVPPDTLDKMYRGKSLTDEESEMIAAHPGIGQGLVANIPRLEGVGQTIAYQQKCFDGSGIPEDSVAGEDIPLGARILKITVDYDKLKSAGEQDVQIIAKLHQDSASYDPAVLAAMERVIGLEASLEAREVGVHDLTLNMILAEDVTTCDGALVVGKGQEVTDSLRERLRNFARKRNLQEPIHVLVQT